MNHKTFRLVCLSVHCKISKEWRRISHLPKGTTLLVPLLQEALQMVDVHIGFGESPGAFVLLLCSFGRQPFALQHLQELLDGLVSGHERLLLCFDAKLHLLQRLSQEEEFLGLPLVLAVQPVEVLLCELGCERLSRPGAAQVLLEQLVKVTLDTKLILQGLDGHLEML